MNNQPSNEEIVNYENEILETAQKDKPYISTKMSIDSLINEYSKPNLLYSKALDISKKYKYIRRINGDGNCFYRGFGTGLLEIICLEKSFEYFSKKLIEMSKDLPIIKYEDTIYESFLEVGVEIINKLSKVKEDKYFDEMIYSIMNSQNESNYFIYLLRLYTSVYLQMNEDKFSLFVEESNTLQEYCKCTVESFGKEADQLSITALSEFFQIGLSIIYMDGTNKEINVVNIGEYKRFITLLYRPGHYDMLYV